jgi:hypothetical protein
LETLGALEQVEFHHFAFIKGAIAILLDRGKMDKDILSCGPLNESIAFSPIKPLYCALLSHGRTPFDIASRFSSASFPGLDPVRTEELLLHLEPEAQKKAPESVAVLHRRQTAPEPIMHTHTALLRHQIHLATLYWSLDQTLMPSFLGNEQQIICSELYFGKQINEFSCAQRCLKRFLSGCGEACATMLTCD